MSVDAIHFNVAVCLAATTVSVHNNYFGTVFDVVYQLPVTEDMVGCLAVQKQPPNSGFLLPIVSSVGACLSSTSDSINPFTMVCKTNTKLPSLLLSSSV